MPRAIEPTDQQLREACARMAQRFRWVGEFEAVMQDPARSRLVRIAAMHPTAASTPANRAPAARPGRASRPLAGRPARIDLKRAASGERDDD